MKKLLLLVLSLLMTTTAYAEPLFSRNDYNEDIIKLHQKLAALGLFSLRAESPYGPQSEEAVRTIQGILGLEETGYVEDDEQFETIMAVDSISTFDIDKAKIIENLFKDVE